ncbi:MAG: immunoglobulin domain-containing protein [Holophagaceae bacterium]
MRAAHRLLTALGLLLAAAAQGQEGPRAQAKVHPDHHEFEAMLFAPFAGERGALARTFKVAFSFPDAEASTWASWRLELVNGAGEVVRRWHGEAPLVQGRGLREIAWDGRGESGQFLRHGFYTLRLSAAPTEEAEYRTAPGGAVDARVEPRLARAGDDLEVQEAVIQVGRVPAPSVSPRAPLPVGARQGEAAAAAPAKEGGAMASRPATASLPYTIYYGNMHSQTNHSDGGTPVGSCSGAETPQAGTQGPTEAFDMMRVQAGGDFLLASEHNHMYDGSTSENTSADTVAARNLWQSGQSLAASYRSAHPDFMALYGNEWGVITNGGHMNLLNPDGLATWEHGAGGLLTGDYYVPKSDYAAMYALMKQRGWIGQFNHPKTSGQFVVGGTNLAFDANGAEVMALCEVMNTSAFSTNTTETETGHSSYASAWNILLERGYHVAPTTDQDNHCANWGLSYRNRTGVLIPTGTALTLQSFLDAVKARRVFATEDKAGQLVLTANGHVMGEAFSNAGTLTLVANYASTSGQTASRIQFFEGVPGRNGTVTQLTEGTDTYAFTPAAGDHFYYAIVTQANGDKLFSAPVWVTQGSGGATAPAITGQPANATVTAPATATFSVTASGTAPLAYQWQKNGAAISGATAASYTTPATATADSGATFRCVVTNSAGSATSNPATLTVNAAATAPAITTQPASVTVTAGATATFTVAATGTAPMSYQWQKNGAAIAGATAASYTTPATTTADSGATFRCVVSNSAGSATSSSATLTVNAAATAPTITTQPASQTVTAGATATFTVAASGTSPFTYQWRKNGTAISGATAASYTTPATTTADSGSAFSVVVSNSAGSATSGNATLTVNGSSTTFTEVESNGTLGTANVVARTYTGITGTMGNTTDKDHFALSLNANEKLTLGMTGPSTADYDLYLLDSAGTTLASSTSGTSTESLTWTNGAAARTVYAQVISYSGSSTTVPYNLTLAYTAGTPVATELLGNPGFESGAVTWTATSGVITNGTGQTAHGGSWMAWLNGYGSAHTDSLYQQVSIPSTATSATLTFWLHVDTAETTTTTAYDTLKVQVRNSSNAVLATLATYSNLNKNTGYAQKTFDLSAYKGQTVRVYFEGVEGGTLQTSFVIDDASLKVQ